MKATIIDNKYHKVLVVAQRTKQLQKGARPLVQMPGVKATRVAFEEGNRGLVEFEVSPEQKEQKQGRE
jgi:DNA-directed RNA polymerase subunit K/omega